MFVAKEIDPFLTTIETFSKVKPGDGIQYGVGLFPEVFTGRNGSTAVGFADVIHILAELYLNDKVDYKIIKEYADSDRYVMRGWRIENDH